MTRYEKKLQESNGESAWQFLLQMIFYLHIIKLSVIQNQMEAQAQINKNYALELSVTLSLLSITNGQHKVGNKTNLTQNN